MNLNLSSYLMSHPDSPSSNVQYNSAVASSLFGEEFSNIEEQKVLALKEKAPNPVPGYHNHLRALFSQNVSHSKPHRICQNSERTLDAPGLVDNFYLNLIDWSSRNIVAVALLNQLYLLDASSANPQRLVALPNQDIYLTSVSWSPSNPSYLSVGTSDSSVSLWDVSRGIQLRRLEGYHNGRVSSSSWNNAILSTGSADSKIVNWDVRARNPFISALQGHTDEVCGLKWNLDGTQLASGSNDNLLNIWNLRTTNSPQFQMNDHVGAVKALSWCPWQPGLLASGGGTADRCIKFWNTQNGNLLNSTDTESQVCSLLWSPLRKELLSCHGFSKNQINIWKYPQMEKISELVGHSARVLDLAMSPDGTCILSAGADETIKFWRIADPEPKKAIQTNAFKTDGFRSIHSTLNKIR